MIGWLELHDEGEGVVGRKMIGATRCASSAAARLTAMGVVSRSLGVGYQVMTVRFRSNGLATIIGAIVTIPDTVVKLYIDMV